MVFCFPFLQINALDDSMIFFLASLPEDEYSILLNIFEKYENCDMKDQKLSRASRKNISFCKLDLKGVNFKPLRGLELEERKALLMQLESKEISFVELATICRNKKRLKEVQQQFMMYLNLKSWQEAKIEYPEHSKDELLKPFMGLSFKKGNLPPCFTAFCQQAKQLNLATSSSGTSTLDSATNLETSNGLHQISIMKDKKALVMKANVLQLDTKEFLSSIRRATLQFTGMTLTIIDPPEVIVHYLKL